MKFEIKSIQFTFILYISLVTLILSSVITIPGIVAHRRDDLLLVIILTCTLGVMWGSQIYRTKRIFFEKEHAYFNVLIFAFLAWQLVRVENIDGLIETCFMALMLVYIGWSLKISDKLLFINNHVRLILLSYLIYVYFLMGISGWIIHDFKHISGINPNTLFLPVLPLFGLIVAELLGLVNRKKTYIEIIFDIIILCLFLYLVILSSSKQTVFFTLLILLSGMILSKKYFAKTIIFILLLALIASFVLFGGKRMLSDITDITDSVKTNYETPGLANRMLLAIIYIRTTINDKKLLTGFGTAQYKKAFDKYVINGASIEFLGHSHSPHDSWLRLFVEGGLPSLILMALVNIKYVRSINSIYLEKENRIYIYVIFFVLFGNSLLTESMFSWEYWIALSVTGVVGRDISSEWIKGLLLQAK